MAIRVKGHIIISFCLGIRRAYTVGLSTLDTGRIVALNAIPLEMPGDLDMLGSVLLRLSPLDMSPDI